MKIPRSIDVYGQDVNIVISKDLKEEKEASGEYCDKKKEITIDQSLKGELLKVTFIHECFHAISDRVSIREAIPTEVEEIIVDSYAKWLVENFELRLKCQGSIKKRRRNNNTNGM